MRPSSVVSLFLSFAAYAAGSAVVERRQATTTTSSSASSTSLVADSACTNDADHRACWSDGFSIATDFDQKHPTTGNTVYYDWTITNTTGDPDGTGERIMFLVNGQYPGPTLYAEWGDMISVTIHNDLPNNGTGIHWHGIRQLNTVDMDGVPGITECPTAPSSSRTYTFQATQFGTSWYHSHFSVQYGQGVLGPIIINGPATANYDVDLGAFPITDWYPLTAYQEGIIARTSGPPQASNGLINGTMVSPDGSGGAYLKTTITAGKRYRIRIINTSVDNHFRVTLDNHPFSVITSDFVPIKPYTADWLFVGIGQRYDVIIEANQTSDNYWFRVHVPSGCGSNANNDNILSIFHYSNATDSDPTSTHATTAADTCIDETQLVPYWDSFVPSDPLTANPTDLNVSAVAGVTGNNTNIIQWAVNFTALNVNWDKPTLEYIQEGNTSYPAAANVISIATDADWTYWVLTEVTGSGGLAINVPHPIHLHGHDFYVLGADTAPFTTDVIAGLNFDNPARRDTAMLPAGGYLVIAFETNNPGAWIMHCHIAWHVSDGLGVQFLETPDEISIGTEFNDVCGTWVDYYPEDAVYLKDDSGV